jgi:GNAT superfamily N-acetyltransferase
VRGFSAPYLPLGARQRAPERALCARVVPIEIRPLADCPSVPATLAEWHWPEWVSASTDGTLAGLRERLASWTTSSVPCILVAFRDDEPVGSVALLSHDMEEPEPRFAALTPWLSGLFVVPRARRQGAGSALVVACERRAKSLGHDSLFLYTGAAERFYAGRGWETIGRAKYDGDEVAVMRATLG